jgi:hypothetical protein
VDNGVRLEAVDDRLDEGVVGQVADMNLDLPLRDLAPRRALARGASGSG